MKGERKKRFGDALVQAGLMDKNELGTSVADVGDVEAVAAELPHGLGVQADISTEAGNVELIEQAEAAFGPIDLFFANAGVGGGTDLSTPEADWRHAFDVNVNAHRWAVNHLLDGWLARGEGYFCSTASAAGLLLQIGSAPYTLTKRAAVAFAEWLAVTYGERGLRVSCLCPQGVNTEMLRYDAPQPLHQMPGEKDTLVYLPIGVGAAITPWNFPLVMI